MVGADGSSEQWRPLKTFILLLERLNIKFKKLLSALMSNSFGHCCMNVDLVVKAKVKENSRPATNIKI